MGRPGGDEHALAGQRARLRRGAAALGRGATISSGSAMRPMPASPVSAISPAFGPTMATPSAFELRDVAAGRGIAPTSAGSWPARAGSGRSVASSMAVARSSAWPLRHLGHQVGGGRRDDDQIAVARQPDMADVELAPRIEQVGVARARPASAPAASGVTNCCAARVRTQRTCSAALLAAAGSGPAPCRPRCRRR